MVQVGMAFFWDRTGGFLLWALQLWRHCTHLYTDKSILRELCSWSSSFTNFSFWNAKQKKMCHMFLIFGLFVFFFLLFTNFLILLLRNQTTASSFSLTPKFEGGKSVTGWRRPWRQWCVHRRRWYWPAAYSWLPVPRDTCTWWRDKNSACRQKQCTKDNT